MSAVAHSSAFGGTRNGGVAARRAVTRWAGRMFRREWRQQLLVVTLLTVAVAAAIGSITLVYNTDAATNSEFGSANTVLEFDAHQSAQARSRARHRQEVVRNDGRHRPPLGCRSREHRQG